MRIGDKPTGRNMFAMDRTKHLGTGNKLPAHFPVRGCPLRVRYINEMIFVQRIHNTSLPLPDRVILQLKMQKAHRGSRLHKAGP